MSELEGRRVVQVTAQTEGGIGRHVASLIPELLARGAIPKVVAPARVRELVGDIDFVEFEMPQTAKGLLRKGLRSALMDAIEPADLVHAHGMRAGAAATSAFRRSDVEVITTVHNAPFDGGLWSDLTTAASDRVMANHAARRIYVSKDMAQRAISASPARAHTVVTIPAGALLESVSEQKRKRARDELAPSHEGPIVLTVGRLHPQKGYDVLIRAVEPGPEDASYFIVGEGPERDALAEEISRSSVGDRVTLLGARKDTAALMAAADVVCMPSRWEGSPLALHEALFLGKPVVASAVGGIVDALDDGVSGILVTSEDPRALAEALRRVVGDPALRRRLSEGAKKAAEQWPDAERTAKSIADLYEEVLRSRDA